MKVSAVVLVLFPVCLLIINKMQFSAYFFLMSYYSNI